MKLDFEYPTDNQYHQLCINCHAETVSPALVGGYTFYDCGTCGRQNERSLVFDPGVVSWVDEAGEYWHESAGVFVRDPNSKFLFFERTIFPFELTVPSGHLNVGETALNAALRETKEEVGIQGSHLVPICVEDIRGDSCRRGSDVHRWHGYLLPAIDTLHPTVNDEGRNPTWLTLQEAVQRQLTTPVRYVIERYSDELTQYATTD